MALSAHVWRVPFSVRAVRRPEIASDVERWHQISIPEEALAGIVDLNPVWANAPSASASRRTRPGASPYSALPARASCGGGGAGAVTPKAPAIAAATLIAARTGALNSIVLA